MADQPDDQADEERRDAFAQDGADLAGGLANLAISVVANPVLGVISGVAVTRLVRLGLEVWDRMVEPRQRRRASGAWEAAIGRALERTQEGDVARNDRFLEPDELGESPASELMEGVMIHAANAYQQRKVPYIGFLWSSVFFRSDVSLDYGHFLLSFADRLTYRQLQAIAFFAENAGSEELGRLQAKREHEGGWWFADGLGVELNEAGDIGVLGVRQPDGDIAHPRGTYGAAGIESMPLRDVVLTPLGGDLYELMELHRIPTEEKQRILELIRAGH